MGNFPGIRYAVSVEVFELGSTGSAGIVSEQTPAVRCRRRRCLRRELGAVRDAVSVAIGGEGICKIEAPGASDYQVESIDLDGVRKAVPVCIGDIRVCAVQVFLMIGQSVFIGVGVATSYDRISFGSKLFRDPGNPLGTFKKVWS